VSPAPTPELMGLIAQASATAMVRFVEERNGFLDPRAVRYTSAETALLARGRPFAGLSDERLVILVRHWLWADHARGWLMDAMERRIDATGFARANHAWGMTEPDDAAMLVWYGLLHVLVEAVAEDGIETVDPLRADLVALEEPLRESRNSVFRVPDSYVDAGHEGARVSETIGPLHRVHGGLGDLLLAEIGARPELTGA
jgi:hypothetical protein